ncbi:unnamed protein product [Gadus morhua 'NCC']
MSHPKPSPGSQFIPGELLRIESTMEDGAYESETQEKGAKDAQDAMVNTRPPQPKATVPMGSSEQPFPYDLLFLTGQYARGTYPDFTKSVERGRDDWQVNHYRRYDHAEDQRVQSFPSASDKSFLTPRLCMVVVNNLIIVVIYRNEAPEDQSTRSKGPLGPRGTVWRIRLSSARVGSPPHFTSVAEKVKGCRCWMSLGDTTADPLSVEDRINGELKGHAEQSGKDSKE